MKKILLLMLSVVAALTSCQKSDLDGFGTDGMVDVTVAAAMDGASATTRATAGDGTTVDRCILEVYTGGDLYKRMVASVNQTALTASFDLRLVSSQTYEFLLWADKSNGSAIDDTTDSDNHYETTNPNGLKEISADYTSYAGNDETRDAFYYAETMEITASTVIKADLTRPFGQVNVKTDLTDVREDFYPKSVAIEYTTKVYNTFNVLTGDLLGTETAIKWSAAAEVMVDKSGESTPYIDLSTDYLFASDDQQDVHNFEMTFYSDESGTNEITTNKNFTNIPVQRNYRTNISGDLLTKQGTINVTIKPEFTDPDNDVKIEEVANVDAANDVIKEATGDVSIKIVEQVSGANNNIDLPAVKSTSNVENVTVDFSDLAANTDITIGDSSSEVYDGTINIVVSSAEAAQQVTVNAPAAHVVFYGKAGEVISETSPTTFVVEAGAEITTLTVKDGNVEIYGKVSTIAQDASNTGVTAVTIFTQGKGVDYAATMVGNIAALQANDNFEVMVLDNTNIKNATTGKYFSTISDAVDAANENDIIELAAGEYNEELTINKPLTIKGAQAGVSGLSANRNDMSKESSITKTLRMAKTIDGAITLDGLYFPQSEGTSYRIYVNNIDKLVVTNCIANGIEGNFVYSDEQSTLKKEVEITNNKVIGTYGSNTHIFVYNTKKMTITNNYLSSAGRAINLAVSAPVTYDGERTQATIENNTITNMSNYAVQTSYYPYGKIVVNNNKISDIDCGTDGEEEGAINIRGYQPADGNGELEYVYEITNNTFTNVASVFLTRLYSKTDDSGLVIGDDKVVISGNTIRNVSKWILRCDDDKDYDGTIDLSDNNISYSGNFADYLYLLGNAKVLYGDETYPDNTISSVAELEAFALRVNTGNTYIGKTVTLGADLDLTSIADWTPIGSGTRSGSGFTGCSFQGIFDGNNKTIKNLNIISTTGGDAAVGLFGVVSGGTVKNITLENVNINVSTSEMAAGAVGMLTGSDALVDNVKVTSGTISASRGNGAIVGRMTVNGTISNCVNYATINATGANVGGIIGAAYYTKADEDMYIKGCTNNGVVTGTAGAVAGIVGLSAAHISNCKNTANITGNGADVAGIVAEQKCYGSVKSCTNSGDIKNNAETAYGTGGIVGWIRYNGDTTSYANQCVIEVSGNNNSGAITGGNDAGGIVGTCYNNGVINTNTNTAPTISSSQFAAGIVGNAQFTENTNLGKDNCVEVKNNISTTALENIIGTCTNVYVYDNSDGAYVTKENNNNQQ